MVILIDIYNELTQFGLQVDICDPWASKEEVQAQFGIGLTDLVSLATEKPYNAIILAVAHEGFTRFDLGKLLVPATVVFDTKAILDRSLVDGRL